MADLNYVAEKFHTAVFSLVKNQPPQMRLRNAYMSFHPILVKDFNDQPELQEAYKNIIDRLPRGGAGPPPSSIDQMSDSEAQALIDLIVDFTFLADSYRR
jgi:ABC-type amino acid transport substrate-binding protein